MKRRHFVQAIGAGLSAGLIGCRPDADATTDFTLAHVTDLHIQPELRAADGCRQCIAEVNRLAPDFVITGGDLVFDVGEVARPRATMLYDLYGEVTRELDMPVHNVIGNHDVFGIEAQGLVDPTDPLYGKKMYEDRFGARYYHFEYRGWQFITLDSIAVRTDGSYYGFIDDEQFDWLRTTLDRAGPGTPIVVATHIPLMSTIWFLIDGTDTAPPPSVIVANTKQVLELLQQYNVKAVLQGHTHIAEVIDYQGCQYISSGAVCGNWWRGPRMGHAEGFGLLRVRGTEITWSYREYGFQAAVPPEA